jgi:hypothetical protein
VPTKYVGCGEGPRASLSYRTPRLRAFLAKGFTISIGCEDACTVLYELTPVKYAGIHNCACPHHNPPVVDLYFWKIYPPQTFTYTGKLSGRATLKGLGRLKVAKFTLVVHVLDALNIDHEFVRTIAFKR